MRGKKTSKSILSWVALIAVNVLVLVLAVMAFNKYFMVSVQRRDTVKFLSDLSRNSLSTDHFSYRKPHPYVGFRSQASVQYATGETFINSHGFKSPELGDKHDKKIRIAMLGGSVAFQGTPNTNRDDIIAKVSQKLESFGYDVDYINTGSLSFISNQELNTLVDDILDMDVDIVISLDGFNDIHHIMYYNGRVGWPSMRWDDFGSQDPEIKQECPAYYPAIKPSLLNKEIHAKTLDNYLDNIYKISKICMAFDMQYIALLQPLRGFGPDSCGMANVDDVNFSKKVAFYCGVQDVFREWDRNGSNNGVYISIAGLLKDKLNLFQDECHFTSDGNEIVADKIVEIIKERKILDRVLSREKRHKVVKAVDSSVRYDLFSPLTLDDKISFSLNGIENDGDKKWRWVVGSKVDILVDSQEACKVKVHYSMGNPLPGQSVTVYANGVQIAEYKDMPASKWLTDAVSGDIYCDFRKGENSLAFQFGLTNGVNATFSETDKTPYSAYFTELSIQQVN